MNPYSIEIKMMNLFIFYYIFVFVLMVNDNYYKSIKKLFVKALILFL